MDNRNSSGPYRKKWVTGEATQAAFLLGGIGTGNVSLGSRGQLMDWELFNRPAKGVNLPYSFFAIRMAAPGEPPVSRVLESRIQPPFVQGLGHLSQEIGGLPRFKRSRMAAEYPFAEVALSDERLPVDVELTAFTPFVPLNADDSGIPCAQLRYVVRNKTAAPVEVSVAGSLCNATEYRGVDMHRGIRLGSGVRNEYREADGLCGLYFDNPDSENGALRMNSMALATPAGEGISAKPVWLCGGWFDGVQDFWDEFSGKGSLSPCAEEADRAGRIGIETYKVGSLCVRREIPPMGEAAFEFTLSWYFPVRFKGWEHDAPVTLDNGVRNRYAALFAGAWDVQRAMRLRGAELAETSRAFQKALYGSTLPDAVLRALGNNLTVLRSPTCFRLEDGTFLAWEGCAPLCGSCSGTCTHVWNYAQSAAFLFPELEQSARRVELLLETEPDGEMVFRTHRVFGLPAWKKLAAADGQPGVIVRLYREWKLTGDDAFLRELYPKARLAIDFIARQWDIGGDGVLSGEQHNTYDIEFYGMTSMTNGLYFAALKAMAEMAEYLGERADSIRYAETLAKGSARMDGLLWNGEYYRQLIDDVNEHKYQYGEGCLSDQLFGQMLARVAGLGDVLPAGHVREALKSIYRYNFKNDLSGHANAQRAYTFDDEAGLLICTWPHGGRPNLPFVYADEVWTGIEYQVAAHMLYEGMLDEGLAIVEAVQARQDGVRRNPWNENECGNHYARSLASWALLTALSGFGFDMARGEVSFRPAYDGEFRCFFSTGKAWGVYARRRREDGALEEKLDVLSGDPDAVRLAGN